MLAGLLGWSCCCSTVVGFFVVLFAALVCFAVYLRLTLGVCKSAARMEGKTVLITGANGGIGRETTIDIARRGARIIMACRNLESANQVRDEIIKETKNENIVVRKLDLSSLKSVREFAAEVNKTENRLDVLIHNAGVANVTKKQTTEDGLELTMATNHYGPFLLTHLLIDLLKRSAPSRIVVVSSLLYRVAKVNLNDPNPVTTIPLILYYVSKNANILFTKELARRLEGTGVTANCLHPGIVDTGIWRNVPIPLNWPLQLLLKCFSKDSKEGAQTSIHLAVSEEVEGISGEYFEDCKITALKGSVQNVGKAKKFWDISEGLAQLTSTDPRI